LQSDWYYHSEVLEVDKLFPLMLPACFPIIEERACDEATTSLLLHDTIQVQRSKGANITTHWNWGPFPAGSIPPVLISQFFTSIYHQMGLAFYNGGLTHFMLPNKTHSPVELCENPAAFS